MFQLDFKNGAPICDQIVNGFIKLKALGVLKGGDQLPSVRALASKFSINPNTVQKSYALLEASGIIYSIKGKGSFIADDESATNAVLESAYSDFESAINNAVDLGLSKQQMLNLVEKVFTEKEGKQP